MAKPNFRGNTSRCCHLTSPNCRAIRPSRMPSAALPSSRPNGPAVLLPNFHGHLGFHNSHGFHRFPKKQFPHFLSFLGYRGFPHCRSYRTSLRLNHPNDANANRRGPDYRQAPRKKLQKNTNRSGTSEHFDALPLAPLPEYRQDYPETLNTKRLMKSEPSYGSLAVRQFKGAGNRFWIVPFVGNFGTTAKLRWIVNSIYF